MVSLSNSALDGKLTLDMVKNRLLNEEARRKEKGNNLASPSDAYVAENKEETCGRSHVRFQQGRNKSRGRSKSQSRRDIICFHCKKPGHKRNECKSYKKEL